MELTGEQKRGLRARAHTLKPTVQIGRNGVTETQLKQIKDELERHELIKVKFNDYKTRREELSDLIAEKTGSERIQLIGNTLVLYKEKE
ncbi:ribosome assembly RNA-binding protein YhbY [Candidatus Bathyarchaeota archaeon]|nr:ribosome assembly RNA-binding protein YhbY [Candidatus Bathyarchaeota archaeon]